MFLDARKSAIASRIRFPDMAERTDVRVTSPSCSSRTQPRNRVSIAYECEDQLEGVLVVMSAMSDADEVT